MRFKARLVMKGYAQEEGIDYNEVFSMVVKHSSIQILLALVTRYGLELDQLDVKTIFLHGDLNEKNIYDSAIGIPNCREGKPGLQVKEIVIRFEAVSSTVV